MTEAQIAGIILLLIGGLEFIRPDLMIKLQIWTQKKLLGAEYIPTTRTYKVVRVIGVVIFILGLLVITGIIE